MNPLDKIYKEIDRLWLKEGNKPTKLYIGWLDWENLCKWYVENCDTRQNRENYAESICGLKTYIVKNDSHHFYIC